MSNITRLPLALLRGTGRRVENRSELGMFSTYWHLSVTCRACFVKLLIQISQLICSNHTDLPHFLMNNLTSAAGKVTELRPLKYHSKSAPHYPYCLLKGHFHMKINYNRVSEQTASDQDITCIV